MTKLIAFVLLAGLSIPALLIAYSIKTTHDVHRACIAAKGTMIDEGCRFDGSGVLTKSQEYWLRRAEKAELK